MLTLWSQHTFSSPTVGSRLPCQKSTTSRISKKNQRNGNIRALNCYRYPFAFSYPVRTVSSIAITPEAYFWEVGCLTYPIIGQHFPPSFHTKIQLRDNLSASWHLLYFRTTVLLYPLKIRLITLRHVTLFWDRPQHPFWCIPQKHFLLWHWNLHLHPPALSK